METHNENFQRLVVEAARQGASRQDVTEAVWEYVRCAQEGFGWWDAESRAVHEAGERWAALAAFFPEGEEPEETPYCFPESWFPAEEK